MVDYVFVDNSGTFVRLRTDAVDLSTNRFTIMEVNGAPGGIYNLSNALQAQFGRKINQDVTTKADLVALAVALGFNLLASLIGPAAVAAPTTVSSVTLAAPTLTGATGSGAAGTDHLTWPAVTNATNYIIDRATNVGFTTGVTLGVFNGPLLVFNDAGLTAATQYFYRIRAQGANGYTDSAFGTASATTHA